MSVKKSLSSVAMRAICISCACVLLIGLAGCASFTRTSSADSTVRDRNSADDGVVHADLIRAMLAKQQYYAALAHVEEQKRISGSTRELRLLEAEARRKLGQVVVAEIIYKELLSTQYRADAEHGLGLLYAKRNINVAVQHLRSAVQRRPTQVTFRNDLGYALMVSGRYKEALPELATAVELDPNDSLSRNNLITLLLVTKEDTRAKQIARSSGVSDDELAGLRRKAQSLMKPR